MGGDEQTPMGNCRHHKHTRYVCVSQVHPHASIVWRHAGRLVVGYIEFIRNRVRRRSRRRRRNLNIGTQT